jgi:hypothetical protein
MPSGGLVANHNRNQCITSTLGGRKFTVNIVAGEERARKVFSLEGPPGDGGTSRLSLKDPVDGGTRCGPHGGETSKTKSWTIEPVHGGGRVKWFGGRPD